MKQVLHDRIGARQIDRAVRIGKAQSLLLAQEVLIGRGVVSDVATRRLIGEPFTDVTLVRAGARGEFGAFQRTGCERAVQPELIADQYQHRTDGRAEVTDGLAEKCVQTPFIDCHGPPSAATDRSSAALCTAGRPRSGSTY